MQILDRLWMLAITCRWQVERKILAQIGGIVSTKEGWLGWHTETSGWP